MKMYKNLPLANTFIKGFASTSVSELELKSLPVIKHCTCLNARCAYYGIKPPCIWFFGVFFAIFHKA